jgi:hypothetical protein
MAPCRARSTALERRDAGQTRPPGGALAASLVAQDPTVDLPRARAAMKALAERHKDLDTLRAQYRQERSSVLTKEPLVSTGTLLFRREPGCLVFRVQKPEPAVILLDERRYQVWRPEQKQLERFVLAGPNERASRRGS